MKCACCDFFTVEGISTICPVCFWQKDLYQEKYMDDDGGPNSVSLREAIKNYKNIGAIEYQFVKQVRLPRTDEFHL